jgi:hypothetical protein
MRSRSCLCVCEPPYQLLNAWTNLYEIWCICHDTWVHLSGVLHKSFPSIRVPLSVSLLSLLYKGSVKFIPPFGSTQRLGKHVLAATDTCKNRKMFGLVCLCVCLCIPLSLLGHILVKILPRQGRFVGGVVFYVVRVISKESRRLVVPRISCSH